MAKNSRDSQLSKTRVRDNFPRDQLEYGVDEAQLCGPWVLYF